MQGHDTETRERLLSTAERLFAERGFSKVTVREICRIARANVAAVNYHFSGKKGLYDEVVRTAIKTMQSTTDSIREAGSGCPGDEQLAAYISIFLRSEEHTSELQSRLHLVCRLLLEKKKQINKTIHNNI